MKKYTIVIAIAAVLIIVSIVFFISKRNTITNKSSLDPFKIDSDFKYIIINDGYESFESRIMPDYNAFKSFIEMEYSNFNSEYKFDIEKYNEKFFNNKSLALINIVTGSKMNDLKDIEITSNDNLLICKAIINYAKGPDITDDVNGIVILVEVNKDITNLDVNIVDEEELAN